MATEAQMRTEIVWWLPFGYRITYSGTQKTRWTWIKLTWRGYLACYSLAWHLMTISPFTHTAARKGE